jgi:hypothetical protein
MLKNWRKRASYQVASRIERAASTAGERLRKNLALPNSSAQARRAAATEFAIRQWALRDAEAANAVKHIDRVRLSYYAQLYVEHGLPPEEARKRAFLFYAALMAEALIVTDDASDVLDGLADMLIGETNSRSFSTWPYSRSTGVSRPKIMTATFRRPVSSSTSETVPSKLWNGPSDTFTRSPTS